MKKRDKTKQNKLEKIALKRALYEKARRQKFLASKNKTTEQS
ncbi:MAG TPA: hypothetical protein VLF62_02825 [Candidatus Saccharimonadales bacterium]|nr:hypothetical protein [Candidatus Saccharimonadales bacterium]